MLPTMDMVKREVFQSQSCLSLVRLGVGFERGKRHTPNGRKFQRVKWFLWSLRRKACRREGWEFQETGEILAYGDEL